MYINQKALVRFIILIFISIPQLQAVQLAYDKFKNGSSDRYSRDDGLKNALKVKGKKKSYKIYNFNSYPNTQVTLIFRMKWKGGWEDSGSWKDYFKVYLNNSQVINDTFSGNASTWKNYSLATQTDNNGDLKVEFYADTTSSREYIAIDDVNITINQEVLPNNDLCYDDVQTNGFCFGVINTMCTIATPINNISSKTLSDVHIALGTSSLFSAFDDCGVNGVSGNCENANGKSYMMFSAFNDGISYNLPDYNPNETQTVYSSAMFSFLNSDYDWVGSYIKDGILHQGKLTKCNLTQYSENKFRDFTIRNPKNTRNIKGNVKFIGNTVLKYDGDNNSEKTNANLNLQYVDVDNNSSTYNSSKVELSLPTDSTIVWAGLYTQGNLNGVASVDKIYQILNEPVYLTAPSIGQIPVIPDVIDYAIHKSSMGNAYGYTYDTYSEISVLEGKKASEVNGWITTANIKCYEGKDNSGLGNFGAWALVVIYKNPNEKLKNISIFDGYKKVADQSGYETVNIPVSGFLTPLRGSIKSTLSLFVGEGDKYIEGDKLYVNNAAINTTNAFDSSISGATRDPSISNNQGIDIQNHDISNIIQNGDTEANITLTSTQDMYFPSVIAFSTDLYEPRICYYIDTIKDDNDHIIFKDKKFIRPIESDKNYHLDIWFSNMKNSVNDEDIEVAKLVQIYMDMKDVNYTKHTTYIQNLNETSKILRTDISGDDIFDFSENINESTFRIGVGANSSQGGTLNPADSFNDDSKKVFVNFQGKFHIYDSNSTSINLLNFFDFKTSFKTNSLIITSDNAQPIEQCIDLNTSAQVYRPDLGSFNVTHYPSSITTTDPLDVNDSKNALYTQVVNQSFNITAVYVGNDNKTLETTSGVIFLDIVDAISTQDPANATVIYDLHYPIFFDDDSIQTATNIKIPIAAKNATFRIKYMNWNQVISDSGVPCADTSNMSSNLPGVPVCLDSGNKLDTVFPGNPCRSTSSGEPCLPINHGIGTKPPYNHTYGCAECLTDYHPFYVLARDNFAIRPDRFDIDINGTSPHKAGKKYNITFKALDFDGNSTKDYNEAVGSSFKVDINETKSGCPIGAFSPDVSSGWNFTDGNQSVQSKYSEVGMINIKLQEINGSEFAKVDEKDTPDSLRLITSCCNDKNISFTPDHFKVEATFKNSGQNFTYVSNDLNMSSFLDINIIAQNEGNQTTKNYNSAYYAKNTELNISYGHITINPSNSITKLMYKEINSSKEGNIIINSPISLTNIPTSIFSTDQNGTGLIELRINFDRNETVATNPIVLNVKDINVSDVDNIKGGESLDQNATFVYGRINVPDYSSDTDTISAKVYYELYCDQDCNKSYLSSLGVLGDESINDIYWYVNKKHTKDSDGDINSFTTKRLSIIPASSPSTITNGVETHTITYSPTPPEHKTYPYGERVNINASKWLIYNPFNSNTPTSFSVSFSGSGEWNGIGKQKTTVDTNISKKDPKRIEW